MGDSMRSVREHLARVLDWEDAHVNFDKAIAGLPPDRRGALAGGFEHSVWQLLEHIRIAQDDILDFCVNGKYGHALTWPDDYWPKDAAPPSEQAWNESVASCARSREEMKRLALETNDLTARVPTGSGEQTFLRAVLLAADHASYHVGQIVAVRRALGIWPAS
jgi:uncharacterized damage-inducible protein DinB